MDVYIDFKSPTAYLAFKPTLELAARTATDINWHPVLTRQSPIPEEQANEDRGTTHRRVRAIARQNMHLHYAQVLGVPMQFRTTPGATDLALVALENLQGDRGPFVQAAFNAYWTTDANLSDPAVVASLLDSVSATSDLNDPDIALSRVEARALQAGAIDAPAYVVADELFIGREHIPWIESLLGEKDGE